MGKQQAHAFTPSELGLNNDQLSNNPVLQQARRVNSDIATKMNNGPQTTDAFKEAVPTNLSDSDFKYAQEHGAAFSSQYDPTGDEHEAGRVNPVLFGSPAHSDMGRMLLNFIPGAAAKLGDQLQYMISGTAKILGADDFASFVTPQSNPATAWLDDTAKEIKAALPEHATAKYDDGSLVDKMMTSKFWTDDIADGAQFLAAMALGSKGVGALAKGAAEATSVADLYNAIPLSQKIATATAEGFTTKTVGFINAAAISAMQANGTREQIEAKLKDKYSTEVNPETGLVYTPQEIDQKLKTSQGLIDEKMNNTFWATMATELAPSIWASKLFLGRGKQAMGQLNSDIVKAVNEGKLTLEDIKNGTNVDVLKKTGFTGLREAAKAAAVGGPVAMNLQQSIQQYDVDQAVGGKGGSAWDSKYGYVKQFLDNFSSSEGLKSMVLGSVLGAGAGFFHGKGANAAYNEAMGQHLTAMKAADGLYGGIFAESYKGIYQVDPATGKLRLNDNGEPIPDAGKLQKLVFGQLQHKELWDSQTAALLSGNQDIASLNEHIALSQAIASELQSGRYENSDQARQFLKWFHKQRVQEQAQTASKQAEAQQAADTAQQVAPNPEQGMKASAETQSAISTASGKEAANISRVINEQLGLIDRLVDYWDQTKRQAAKLNKIGDTPSRTAFNENVRRTLFYEEAKRGALEEMMKRRDEESKEPGADKEGLTQEVKVLSQLHQDSLDRSSDYLRKPEELFQEWDKFNTERGQRAKDYLDASESLKKENSKENAQKRDAALYKMMEFSAKEGIGSPQADPKTGDINWTRQEDSNGTNFFAINQNPLDRQAVPVGMRNEAQFKAGGQYKEMLQLHSMIDSASKGETPLQEVIAYAHDRVNSLDKVTQEKLRDLIDQQNKVQEEDKQRLASMDSITIAEDGQPDLNPEYAQLEGEIKDRQQALDTSTDLLDRKVNDTELERIQRSPEKQDEYLNQKYAHTWFEKAENVLSNATEQDGSIKETYADAGRVSRAIQDVQFMRDAIEQRMKDKELPPEGYQYLLDKADQMLDALKEIQKVVAENQVKRDMIQKLIGQRHAEGIVNALGFDLEKGTVTNPAIFNIADQALGGKLAGLIAQLDDIGGDRLSFEGGQVILNTLKSALGEEGKVAMLSALEDQLSASVSSIPEPRSGKHLKDNFASAPEIYLVPLLRSMTEGQTELNEEKNSPINQFMRDNDIQRFQDSVNSLPEGDISLGLSREKLQAVLQAYKDIVSTNVVKNYLDSSLSLSDLVSQELKTPDGPIVPTTQQEMALRDALAWLGGKEVGTGAYAGWGFLRGIAGTGKTSVVMKWLMKLSGLEPDQVMAAAATEKAAGILGTHLSIGAMTTDDLMEGEIPTGKKLIIIDEYARVTSEKLAELQNKIQIHNKGLEAKDRVRVLILGDPTQISPETFRNQDITDPSSNKAAKRIRVINPLTVVYRSDVSAVTQTSDLFQDNPSEVKSINVSASGDEYTPHAVGSHTGKTSQGILDMIQLNQKAEDPKGLGYSPRTRVVIVDKPEKAALYEKAGVEVISVYDAQSATYDEVYVDMDRTNFYDTRKYNDAMYTAASRAQEYSYIKYPEGKNTADSSLLYEKDQNDKKASEARKDYIDARTQEQSLMEQAAKGEELKVDQKTKQQEIANQSPLDKATAPEVDQEQEIVAESPSVDENQTLPGDTHPSGAVDPETEGPVPPTSSVIAGQSGNGHLLSNIESDAFGALKGHHEGNSDIGVGSSVHYLHTKEKNGQDSVTIVAIGKEGEYIPVAKIFQGEIGKYPVYADLKEAMQHSTPVDIKEINPRGNRAGIPIHELNGSVLKSSNIITAHRLNYTYGEEPQKGKPLLQHISDLFKLRFYHSNEGQQARADKVHYKIFRKNELEGTSKRNKYTFGGFTPQPGVPYAIVGIEPGSTNYADAQFVRLSVNPYTKESQHYSALKSYYDTVTEIERQTGIRQGSTAFSRVIKALKGGLEVHHEDTPTGSVPKLRLRENYTPEELLEAVNKANEADKSAMPPELDALFDPKNREDLLKVLPHLQSAASQVYGIKETPAILTKQEAAHYPDYEHIPVKGESGENPKGRLLLKNTGGNTGRKAIYHKTYEIEAGKGPAQQAFDQLAKANEFAGGTRIRVEDYAAQKASKGRATVSTGKSLTSDSGGFTAVSKARPVLAELLGHVKIAEGKLEEADLERPEVKADLQREVRQIAGENKTGITETGNLIAEGKNIDPALYSEYMDKLAKIARIKDTNPVDSDTLKLMVGDNNFDEAGNHRTEQQFNVQDSRGQSKVQPTSIRQPLDIDHFNKLGMDPKANASELEGMVSTRLQDINPTAIEVGEAKAEKLQPKTAEEKIPASTPGADRALQAKIDDLQDRISKAKGKEKIELIKEMKSLRDERYGSARLFESNQRGKDIGELITADQARELVRQMLPSASPSDLQFLDRMAMLKLQKPGENLLGLFQDGKILLREDDGSVGAKVVRHEIFHAIYNDYLTGRERKTLNEAFDPMAKLNPDNLEEALADHFMNWQRSPDSFGSKVKRIFQRLLSWIGLVKDNQGKIEDLFKRIEDGKYQEKSAETSNTRMAFSDLKKYGTVQEYKNASRKVQGLVYRLHVNDDIENTPLTSKELLPAVYQNLKDEFNATSEYLDQLVEAQQDSLKSYEVETDPELKASHEEDVNLISEEIAKTNQDYATLYRFTQVDAEGREVGLNTLKELWKDLYPNFKTKADIDEFQEDEEKLDPESTEVPEANQSDKENTGITDFTKQSDERNQETKITENVKNFLSFVYRPKTVGKEGSEATRVNPRFVYLQALRSLASLSSSDPNFTEQIRTRAEEAGINLLGRSDASLVVNHILNTIRNASGDSYEFTTGQTDSQGRFRRVKVQLEPSNRFLDEDTFVTHLENEDLSRKTPEEIRQLPEDKVYRIQRQPGASTSDYLKEIADIVGEDKAKGYFRQMQAQEQLREIASTFLSQREMTPMIAEEERGYNTTLKYMRAQAHGLERVKSVDLQEAFRNRYQRVSQDVWAEFARNIAINEKSRAISGLLEAMGIKGHTTLPKVDTRLVNKVISDLQTLDNLIKFYDDPSNKPKSAELDDSDESIGEKQNPIDLALAEHPGLLDRLTRLVSQGSSDQRANSYMDVSGTKRYLFHNGNQATDTLGKLSEFTSSSGKSALPAHFNDPVLAKNIFGKDGLNEIGEVLDHDGQRQKGKEEYAVTYSKETNAQWLKRNFSDAFLGFMKTNASNNNSPLTYMQNFFTISNRPRMIGAEVKVLSEAKIKEALVRNIEQHLEQPDRKDVKNYDRFKAVNFDEMHRAIQELHKDKLEGKTIAEHRQSDEGRAKLGRIYDEISGSQNLKEQVADHMIGQIKAHAEEVLQMMKRERVTLDSDTHQAMRLLKDSRRAVLPEDSPVLEGPVNTRDNYPDIEQLRSSVELFTMNNYVNSYNLAQAVAGNMNYFKDSADLIKRMSGVFAPGTKGLVGKQFFMPEKFRVAVSGDMKMKQDMLSDILKDTELYRTLKKEGFDLTDAQGYMLPERASQIVSGFGNAYNSGAVFKPAHYEVADRGDGTYVPVMLKYSSVVLSDDLVSRFPKLEQLRNEMRNHPDGTIHEYIFNTGVKVGAPAEQVQPGEGPITIPSDSVLSLSNDNFRLQLNPNHDAYDKVANPTQLGYFINVLHKLSPEGAPNLESANKIYSATAEKIQRGIADLARRAITKDGKFKSSALAATLNGVGNERIQEMLRSGIDYNFPNIADKALIQMANMTSKGTVQIKFPGGKMVLQSAFGIEIPSHIDPEQEKFWSNYGKEESAKLQDKARRLEYKLDPETDRWHAEVLLPMVYKDKANPGDFLTSDAMGFRIPSTELHSSVPLKVAGYYDDKGSNIVIAPAELVAQHGSDFDVDSLYVISREQSKHQLWDAEGRQIIAKGHPVGYYPNDSGKLVFNEDRFRADLDRLRLDAANDQKVLAKIEKVHDQLLSNKITEAFLDTISHESNRQRMLTPISTDSISEALKRLGVSEDLNLNTSRLLDNMRMFNSNFQGASLVGIFANGMKALSYLSRSGPEGGYPQLQGENPGITIDGKTYNQFTELTEKSEGLWSTMDALVNTAVDNVKEQKLYLMNATDRTGPVYIAAKALGMSLEDSMKLMLQPVIKRFSTIDGGRATLMNNLKQEMADQAAKLEMIPEAKWKELRTLLPEEGAITDKQLKEALGKDSLGETPEELIAQYHVLQQFEKLQKIGEDITDFSRAIGILQDMDVFYQDVATRQDLWDKLGTVTDGKFYTSDKFSFNMDHLFESQPNIAAAHQTFQWMRQAMDKSLIKHYPQFQQLAKQLSASMGIRLAGDENTNVERIKNEIMSYMVSSYYAKDLQNQEPVKLSGKRGKERVVTGKVAWGQQFAGRLEELINEDKKLPDEDRNPFLKRLAVGDKDGYGIKSITFANSSNPTAEESVEMQEGFSAIKDEQIKRDMVQYAALNYGMSFGVRNYSMFIPSEYLKPLSDFITSEVKDRVESSHADEEDKLISGPLYNLKDNLAIKLAINNVDSLPYIPKKKMEPIHTTDENGKPKYTTINGETVPVRSGYDGQYFWNMAYENPASESGSRKFKEADLPEFIRKNEGGVGDKGRPVAYIRVNDWNNDRVYYQRLGYKNYQGGYDGTEAAIDKPYLKEEYFAGGSIPVPVPDMRATEFETRNEFIKEGQKVIVHPYSNETRELGMSGIVDKVRESLAGDGKKIFTLKQETTGAPNTPEEVAAITAIATELASRFNLDLHIGEGAAGGAKGSFYGDRINLDPRTMTRDTPFHEVAHPLIAAIQQQNPEWFKALGTELKESAKGRILRRKVTAAYPELKGDALEREILVTAIGQEAAKKLPESNFRNLVRRLMRSIGETLRGVISKLKGGGSLGIEDLKNEDLVKLSIGDIADILASPGKFKLDLSGSKDSPSGEVSFSKDLDKPQGIIEKLLALQDDIKDPEIDPNGRQADHYTIGGDILPRISKVMDNFSFRKKEEYTNPDGSAMPTEEAIAKRDADRVFKNTAPGTKLIIEGVEMDKAAYQEQKRKLQLQGQLKGDIIHAQLQRFFTSDPATKQALTQKIEGLAAQSETRSDAYNWITSKQVLSKVLDNAGIHVGDSIPENQRDKVYSEIKVASAEIGAGKIDQLVVKPDGRLQITDWKTGAKLKDKYTNSIMRYGTQENLITDNPLDRAKLQVMLYALIVKAENPEARFERLNVMHIPNEWEATRGRNSLNVEVGDYLRMIEQYYRNEKPAEYKSLLAKSPRIFDPREYNAPRDADYTQEVLNSTVASEGETLQKLRLQLQRLTTTVELRAQEDSNDGWTTEEKRTRDNLMKKILQGSSLIPVNFTGELDSKYEISMATHYLGTINDTHNPYVQAYAQMLNTGKEAARVEFSQKQREFKNLLGKVLEEKGMKQGAFERAFKWVDKQKAFQNLWDEKETVDPDTGVKYLERGLTVKGSEKYNKLSASEKALSDYMAKEMKDIFHDVMVTGKNAIIGEDFKGKPMTKLDLYNKSRGGAHFEYKDNFVPRVGITHEEVAQQALKSGAIGHYLKDVWLRKATDYFENNIEGYNQKDFGLPVRFLGNANTYMSPDIYSTDLQLAFEKYMEQMTAKKHLDHAWVTGQALHGYLESKRDQNGNPTFKHTAQFLDFQMKNILIGDRLIRSENGGRLTRHGITVFRKDNTDYNISWIKMYRSLKSGFAAATLWLQPTRSTKNAIQLGYMQTKEELVNSALRLSGTKLNEKELDLSFKPHGGDYKEALGSQFTQLFGNPDQNFVHQLAKNLRLYTSFNEMGVSPSDSMTRGARLLSTHNFAYLYQMPEEIINVKYALNFLKNLKIDSGNYAGKSMYDMYKNAFDPKTGEFNLPEDFSRGKIQLPDGTFDTLKGLHPMEIQKIHRGIAKLQGGYRPEEKTAIQATILGDALMMFKRWIPAMTVNQFKSKFEDPSIGQFEKVLASDGKSLMQRDGEDVYAWRARVVEGRARVVGKLFASYIPWLKNKGYNWADLSTEQKKSAVDLGFSFATWASLLTVGSVLLGDRKDKDPLKQFTTEMTSRLFEQWAFTSMADSALQPPAVVKKSLEMGQGFGKLISGGFNELIGGADSDTFTTKGDRKGVAQIEKNIPFWSSWYELQKEGDNAERQNLWDEINPF